MRRIIALMVGLASISRGAEAQFRLAEVPSMGQPSKWQRYVVPTAAHVSDRWHGALSLGVHRPLTNPVTGLIGLSGEAYLTVDPGVQPGARAMLSSRALALSAGGDWDARRRDLDWIFSYQSAVRRRGIAGHGTMLRIDWLPGRGNAVNVGMHVPIGQRWAGRTRPADIDVEPPTPLRIPIPMERQPDAIENALLRAAEAASHILAYTNLYPQENDGLRYGQSYAVATRTYHTSLAEAFRIATGNPLIGDRITERARAGILDAVIIPFDSLFGQVKEEERSIRPLTAAAQGSFVQWLRDSSRVAPALQGRLAAVHGRWMQIIEMAHRSILGTWRDSRLLWLPVQLALTEEQYDEQAEVDRLIERAVGRPFTDQNALTYLRSADIPLEIARSVFAARDHHVLRTHDFAGQRDDTRSLDEVGYAMVADVYLPALTHAVQRYDSTRRMPVYMILIDQFFYEPRNGRLWMDILENPLHARMRLPGENAERERHLRARQAELRAAVAKSWRLQQDANANGGQHWLQDVIKVNVNVLLPSDFSFRSHRIIPPWPFVPDNLMRDHRKMAFYDLSAADPYQGSAIIMGVGVGERYASPTWEDRAYRIRGPAAQEARAAARRSLLANGVPASDIPYPLQDARSFSQDSLVTNDYIGRALQVHNEAGFAEKESSVARAMLYNLAPPGSVIIVPDPLWLSDTYAAMLAGAAARGCRVFIISPSKENSPNPQAVLYAVQHDVMWRLMQSAERVKDQMRRTGGELRVGLYTAKAPATNIAARAAEVRDGLLRYPWIRDLIPFDNATLAVLERSVTATQGDGRDATPIAQDETPRLPMLHQKTQLIARPGAIAALVAQPGWEEVLAEAMQTQSQQTAKFADQLGWTTPDVDSSATRRTDALLRGFERSLPEAERKAVSFYFSLGTQNQDPRGLMLDAEATIVVSGLHAAAGLVDLYFLMARTTWIDSKAELDRHLPRPGGFMGRIARMIRFAL